MTIVDLLLGVVILFALLIGLKRGFLKEMASLLGFVLGGGAGLYFSFGLAKALGWSQDSSFRLGLLVAFLVIFLAVFIVFHFVGTFLHQVSRLVMLSWLDHLAGGLFGLAKGVLVILLLVVLASIKPLPSSVQKRIENSYMVSYFHDRLVRVIESCSICPSAQKQELLQLFGPGFKGR